LKSEKKTGSMAKKEYPKNNVVPVDIAGKIPPQAIDIEEAVLGGKGCCYFSIGYSQTGKLL
jgi:hypothetical protein